MMSRMWNLRVTIVELMEGEFSNWIKERRFRYHNDLDHVDLVIFFNGQNHYSAVVRNTCTLGYIWEPAGTGVTVEDAVLAKPSSKNNVSKTEMWKAKIRRALFLKQKSIFHKQILLQKEKQKLLKEKVVIPCNFPMCEKTFSSLRLQRRHQKNIHEDCSEQERTCWYCTKLLKSPRGRAEHQRHCPKNPSVRREKCNLCGRLHQKVRAQKTCQEFPSTVKVSCLSTFLSF